MATTTKTRTASTRTRKPKTEAETIIETAEQAVADEGVVNVDGDHPLSYLIPEPYFSEGYVNRQMKGTEYIDFQILDYAQTEGINVLTYGDTGPGKTAMFMAYASAYGIPIVTVQGNGGIDPNSFWGGPQFIEELNRAGWVDSDVTTAIREGNAIIYIDEINYMPPKTAGAFNSLLDGRRFVTILEHGNAHVKAGPNLLIAGSYNPDYEGTRRINKAFKNRWALKFHIDYDEAVESQLTHMPITMGIATKLRKARKAGDLETPVSTNMLREFEKFTIDLSLDFAIENFLNAFEPEEVEAVRAVFELEKKNLDIQAEAMRKAAS